MKSIRTALVVAIATAALVAVASPASAAAPALPDGDSMYAVSCGTDVNATLLSINSDSGVVAPVGGEDGEYNCGYQGAWDVVTQTYYGVIWDSTSTLVTWDLATGVLTPVGPIVDSVTSADVDGYSLVIGLDGKAYLNDYTTLYEVDLATGVATELGELDALDGSAWGFAVDPTTGVLYLLQEDGKLFTIDPVAVTATYVATWPISTVGDYSYGLAIDSAGTAWVVENPGTEVYSALWSSPLATFGVDPQLSGDLADSEGASYRNWWVTIVFDVDVAPVVPEPALANTGIDVAPLAGAGVLLAAIGIVLVARRRRTA